MRTIAVGAVIFIFAVAAAFATELSTLHQEWFAGPARHLMTKEEMRVWQTLTSDEDAAAFIDLFWARRDPTPKTARNEFREEFDTRVQFADHYFKTARTPGAMSDRGRVLILLGPPALMGGTGAGRVAEPNRNPGPGQMGSGPIDLAGPRPTSARMVWSYNQAKKPSFVKRKEFDIIFLDDRGGGEWELATTERVSPERLLQDAIRHYIVQPDLKAPPIHEDGPATYVRSTSFRNPALKRAYDEFRGQANMSSGSAYLSWGEFVMPGGEHFVPMQLYVSGNPDVAPGRSVTLFGAVENAAGEIIETHENVVTLSANGPDAFVDKTLRLDPGSYTLSFGLAEDGKPLAMARSQVAIEGLDPRSTGASQVILSNNIVALQEAYGADHPFVFGGLKVIPKGDALFTASDNLWYFVELRNPGLTSEGVPSIEVKVDIVGKASNRKVAMNFPKQAAEVTKLRGVEDRYALGTAVPMETFPPGDYTINVELLDKVLDRKYEMRRPFRVRPSS